MLDRLVTVSVVTHIHHSHLTDLVDHTTVVTIIEQRRDSEHGVKHHYK